MANRCDVTKRATSCSAEARRRGSVLVLVMALLGILFVMGIAFLTTMNFEADMIAAEQRRGDAERGTDTVSDRFRGALRDGFLGGPGNVPFGGSGDDGGGATFAELPGVQNTFSQLEPASRPGQDQISGSSPDDSPAYRFFTSASRVGTSGGSAPVPNGIELPVTSKNGEDVKFYTLPGSSFNRNNITACRGGSSKGLPCGSDVDCPDSVCSGPVAVDADGDGIVDSFLADAASVGLSPSQISSLSTQVNPGGNPGGNVFVGLRIIAHGAMANVNASHPTIIEAALGLKDLGIKLVQADGSADVGNLLHRPSGNPNDAGFPNASPRSLYSVDVEEPLLRRRGMIPARIFPPSRLQGDPFTDRGTFPQYAGDSTQFLFWPSPNGGFENVLDDEHRFEMFAPDETLNGNALAWPARMEPFTSGLFDTSLLEYDRRHLVTTVSYDDLLARGGTVSADNGQDVISRMMEVNNAMSAADNGSCPQPFFPFEYADYPETVPNEGGCCGAKVDCDRNIRKGRLRVSLAWIDDRLATARKEKLQGNPDWRLREERVKRVIQEAFYVMIHNAVGEDWLSRPSCSTSNPTCPDGTICKLDADGLGGGRCSASAAYFDDVVCNPLVTPAPECNNDEFCSPIVYTTPDGTAGNYCSDKWTGLRRSEARVARTAASLTANMIDFADADDTPTAIPIRFFDFNMGICTGPTVQAGRVCKVNADCPGGRCTAAEERLGSNFDFDGNPFDASSKKSLFVYGLERQPYITEVGSLASATGPGPARVKARAIELFNPYDKDITMTGDYFIYEIAPGGNVASANVVPITGTVAKNAGATPMPFTVLLGELSRGDGTAVVSGNFVPMPAFQFQPGWTVYLVRETSQPNENDTTGTSKVPVRIVLDQVTIPTDSKIGLNNPEPDCSTANSCSYSRERVVSNPTAMGGAIWTATVPVMSLADNQPAATLGSWNTPPTAGSDQAKLHPVEVQFGDTGALVDRQIYIDLLARIEPGFMPPTGPSFPTTGSMLLLTRHANRAIGDRDAKDSPSGAAMGPIVNLAFTTGLAGDEAKFSIPGNLGTPYAVTAKAEYQIDNGRMPIFDLGEDITDPVFTSSPFGLPLSAHHVAPFLTRPWISTDPFNRLDPLNRQTPGGLENLPWGQLVFDYFTAIPLDSAGPYPPCSGNQGQTRPCQPAGLPNAKPRVDLDGLRVHGRVNLNAAPATILAGLPFVPMDDIPQAFRLAISTALTISSTTTAEPIGLDRARAIVAYRDASEISYSGVRTGDYGVPTDPTFGVVGWRGWSDPAPSARRGTGFMSVGELANVRQQKATLVNSPQPNFPESIVRLDAGFLDDQEAGLRTGNTLNNNEDNNDENFIGAAAFLIALNDWATVRSDVFTIYGHIRGEEDLEIVDSADSLNQDRLRREDVDTRAIRFQETVDRLPTFLGKSLPVRIGNRTVGSYLDVRGD